MCVFVCVLREMTVTVYGRVILFVYVALFVAAYFVYSTELKCSFFFRRVRSSHWSSGCSPPFTGNSAIVKQGYTLF